MIVGWRRFAHSTAIQLAKTLASPRVQLHQESHLNLCPQLVDSVISNCSSDTIALSFFLWCAHRRDYFHASKSFGRMAPVVRRLADRFKTVEKIIEELEGIGCAKKAQTFLVLLRICWQGGMYGLALEVFDEMCRQKFVPNTFACNVVLDILFKIGEFEAAMRFLRATQSPNFITFNIVIANLCKAGDWWGVCIVLREMVGRGFQLNDGTYSIILDCYRKAGRVMELLQLLGFMIVSGRRLSVVVWTILIDGLCRVGKVDVASELFGKMVDCGCPPNVVTYTCLVKGFLESQMYDRATNLLEAMQAIGCIPDLVLYNVLINCLSKARRYEDAIKVFHSLCSQNIKPDSYTLSSLISLLCSSGKLSLFPKLISGLDVSVDLVACNSLLCFFCKAGFPSQVVDLYSYMVDSGFIPDGYTYTFLLDGLCRLGRIEQAVNLYGKIIEKNPESDPFIHTVIISGLVRAGKYHRAIRLFRDAVSENYHLDVVSYTVAIFSLFKGGRFEEARRLFDQMKQLGVVPNIYTYNVMLCGLCKARDVNAVKKLLEDMRMSGVELDCISFNKIICLLTKVHRIHSAFCVYVIMCNMGFKPNWTTYSLLLHGFFRVTDGEVYCLRQNLEETTSEFGCGPNFCDEPFQDHGIGCCS